MWKAAANISKLIMFQLWNYVKHYLTAFNMQTSKSRKWTWGPCHLDPHRVCKICQLSLRMPQDINTFLEFSAFNAQTASDLTMDYKTRCQEQGINDGIPSRSSSWRKLRGLTNLRRDVGICVARHEEPCANDKHETHFGTNRDFSSLWAALKMLKWILFLSVWKSTSSHRYDGQQPRMTGLCETLLFPWYRSWNLSRQVPTLTNKPEKHPDKRAFIDEVCSSWVGTTDANHRHTFGDPSKTLENDHHALEAEATALVCCTSDWDLKALAWSSDPSIEKYRIEILENRRVEGVELVAL